MNEDKFEKIGNDAVVGAWRNTQAQRERDLSAYELGRVFEAACKALDTGNSIYDSEIILEHLVDVNAESLGSDAYEKIAEVSPRALMILELMQKRKAGSVSRET